MSGVRISLPRPLYFRRSSPNCPRKTQFQERIGSNTRQFLSIARLLPTIYSSIVLVEQQTEESAITLAIVNGTIFDSESLLHGHALLVNGGRIAGLVEQERLPADVTEVYDLEGGTLVPGFIDLQVNGGGGVLFNAAPTVQSLRTIAAAHRAFGTTGFLPTLITDSYKVMRKAIAAVRQAIAERVPGVLGIHLEGPFLNRDRKGIHDAHKFCALDEEGLTIVTSLNAGSTLVTLAPELTTPAMISRLVQRGAIVAAGHSAANYSQTRDALAAGVTGFTHLYNAMTPLQSREPGMVGAALEDEESWFGIIADGYHIHPAAFRIAVAAKRKGGAVLVTDAMPSVGSQAKSFVLNGETIVVADGRVTNTAGTLAGSDLNMLAAVNNAAAFAHIDWFEAVRMATLYPARALRLEAELGAIKPGFRANLVALDARHHIRATWIDGIRA
jgi:N-acetylglucosamine-6-phosphate deacetylase